jgi:hypothetical protein
MYIAVILFVTIPALPILYAKICFNAIYMCMNNNREDYQGQNLFNLFVALFFGLPICVVSVIVDLISMPSILLRGSRGFEHKYVLRDNLNEKQTQVVLRTFKKIFTGSKAIQYRGKSLSLGDLMEIHGNYFVLIDNMHDLMCRGTKDYREALKNVQDYNMSKILSSKCSIPDKNGDFKAARCEMDIIYNVQQDVELYNYVDIVFRKYWMGILFDEIKRKSKTRSHGSQEDLIDIEVAEQDNKKAAANKEHEDEEDENEEDEDNQRVGGIEAREIGPDGVPVYRNPTDLMNNFFINYSSLAFTDIQKNLIGGTVNSYEIKRLKRYEKEVNTRKDSWIENTVGQFITQTERYKI